MNSFLLVSDMFSFVFWENPWAWQFAFETIWPLECYYTRLAPYLSAQLSLQINLCRNKTVLLKSLIKTKTLKQYFHHAAGLTNLQWSNHFIEIIIATYLSFSNFCVRFACFFAVLYLFNLIYLYFLYILRRRKYITEVDKL